MKQRSNLVLPTKIDHVKMMLRFDKGVVVLGFTFLYFKQFTSSSQLMKSNFHNRRSLPRNRFCLITQRSRSSWEGALPDETKTVAWETITNVALDPSYAVQVKQTSLITDLRTQSGPERTFTLVITDNEGHLDSRAELFKDGLR